MNVQRATSFTECPTFSLHIWIQMNCVVHRHIVKVKISEQFQFHRCSLMKSVREIWICSFFLGKTITFMIRSCSKLWFYFSLRNLWKAKMVREIWLVFYLQIWLWNRNIVLKTFNQNCYSQKRYYFLTPSKWRKFNASFFAPLILNGKIMC